MDKFSNIVLTTHDLFWPASQRATGALEEVVAKMKAQTPSVDALGAAILRMKFPLDSPLDYLGQGLSPDA